MEIILILIYGIAIAAIIYYMIQLKPMYSPMEKAVTADTEYPRDITAQLVWPWSITSYSFWPSWFHTDGSPVKENYDYTEYRGNRHGGGYGFTGRQNPTTFKSFEGDHYGWDLDGGNYCGGGGYGYTGR
jgi:hypothetical protein